MRFFILIWLVMDGVASGQEAIPPPVLTGSQDQVIEFSWGGLQWRMQKGFYGGVRPDSPSSKELLIQLRWMTAEQTFRSVRTRGDSSDVDVHVRKSSAEDPRESLETIRRANLPFAKLAPLNGADIPGMTYLGSSSYVHYFFINNHGGYVACWLLNSRQESQVGLSGQTYTCSTVIALPSNNFAWINNRNVKLNDVVRILVAAQREVLSFIH